MSHLWMFIFFLMLAYLIGSLSNAILIAKLFRMTDPRSAGSGNPGATNMLRIGGKKLAVIVLIGDVLKGFLIVMIASFFLSSQETAWAGVAAVIGHMYPVFFQFKGGKGVATGVGVLIALSWPLGLAVIMTWIIVAWLTRYSSLAAIIATLCVPLYTYFWEEKILVPLIFMSVLILYRHYGNMRRLFEGSESKIGKSS